MSLLCSAPSLSIWLTPFYLLSLSLGVTLRSLSQSTQLGHMSVSLLFTYIITLTTLDFNLSVICTPLSLGAEFFEGRVFTVYISVR